MRQKGYESSVILYKQQGEKMDDGKLHDGDFVHCIQTSQQADMLKMFGNEKVVCIDATHNTNGYPDYINCGR